MTLSQRKIRLQNTPEKADYNLIEQNDGYPENKPKATATNFATYKFKWLNQIALDASVHSLAPRLAILLATKFLNFEKGSAYPSVTLLARLLNKASENPVRAAIKSLVSAGHLSVEYSNGGKGNTNHFIPILEGKPLRPLKGNKTSNSSKSDPNTPQLSDLKPLRKLNPNTFKENTVDNNRAAHKAPLAVSSEYSELDDTHLIGASSSAYRVGQHIHIKGIGRCKIFEVIPDSHFGGAALRFYGPDNDWFSQIVPVDMNGQIIHEKATWEDEL